MTFLGCTGFTIKYLKAWNLWLMYSNRLVGSKLTPLFYYQSLFYVLVYFTSLISSGILMLQHITAEGTALVQQAEDAATNQV